MENETRQYQSATFGNSSPRCAFPFARGTAPSVKHCVPNCVPLALLCYVCTVPRVVMATKAARLRQNMPLSSLKPCQLAHNYVPTR